MQGWFSPGDHDTVQEASTSFEKVTDPCLIKWKRRRRLALCQVRVMAIGAVKVAPGKKKDTTHFLRIINKGILLKAPTNHL
jgi:hypothetical protein